MMSHLEVIKVEEAVLPGPEMELVMSQMDDTGGHGHLKPLFLVQQLTRNMPTPIPCAAPRDYEVNLHIQSEYFYPASPEAQVMRGYCSKSMILNQMLLRSSLSKSTLNFLVVKTYIDRFVVCGCTGLGFK